MTATAPRGHIPEKPLQHIPDQAIPEDPMVITLRSRAFSPAAALRRSRQTKILRRRGFRAIAVAAAIGLGLTVASSGSATAGSASFLGAAPSVHDQGGNGPAGGGPAINWALAGQATADTSGTNTPASNAVDGDAGTEWCPNQWEGSLTVDLGQVRPLSDVGITMDAAAPAADATIEVASNPSSWVTLPAARNLALDAGQPMYVPMPHGTSARYARLSVKSGTGAPICIGELRLFGPDPATGHMALGGDLSFTPQELAAGAHFTDRGQPGTPVQIMRNNGANMVRMRVWVNPPTGYSDLASDLQLARMVHEAGMKIYLDIMYSDFWADPQHEDIPAAWQGQNLAQLTATVNSYTRQVIGAFAKQGTPVDMVSIGNEIRNGMLWPIGQVDWTNNTGWDNLATLVKSGAAGAVAANPRGHRLQVMVHFDQGGDNVRSQQFYSNLIARGVTFDVIGLSYYTFFHGTISQMRDNVDALATQFHKPIVIAETQYAWTMTNGNEVPNLNTGNFVWQPSMLSPGYPATPGGQLSFVSDELSILAQVPGGLGAGLFYWSPDWIPGVGWEPGANVGSPNSNLTLFDFQGVALPSIGIFRNPAGVCESYNPWNVPCVVGG